MADAVGRNPSVRASRMPGGFSAAVDEENGAERGQRGERGVQTEKLPNTGVVLLIAPPLSGLSPS
jgi:hypothetical protein